MKITHPQNILTLALYERKNKDRLDADVISECADKLVEQVLQCVKKRLINDPKVEKIFLKEYSELSPLGSFPVPQALLSEVVKQTLDRLKDMGFKIQRGSWWDRKVTWGEGYWISGWAGSEDILHSDGGPYR